MWVARTSFEYLGSRTEDSRIDWAENKREFAERLWRGSGLLKGEAPDPRLDGRKRPKRLIQREKAVYALGIGCHALQDIFAHGDITSKNFGVLSETMLYGHIESMHDNYRFRFKWETDRHFGPKWRYRAAQTRTKLYLRSFKYFSMLRKTR